MKLIYLLLIFAFSHAVFAQDCDNPAIEITSDTSAFNEFNQRHYRLTAFAENIQLRDNFQVLHNNKEIRYYLDYESGKMEAFLVLTEGLNKVQLLGENNCGSFNKKISINNDLEPCAQQVKLVKEEGYLQTTASNSAEVNLSIEYSEPFDVEFMLNGEPVQLQQERSSYFGDLEINEGKNRFTVSAKTRCDTTYREFLLVKCESPTFTVLQEKINYKELKVELIGRVQKAENVAIQTDKSIAHTFKNDTLYATIPLSYWRTMATVSVFNACETKEFKLEYDLGDDCSGKPEIRIFNEAALKGLQTKEVVLVAKTSRRSKLYIYRSGKLLDQINIKSDTISYRLRGSDNKKREKWKFEVINDCKEKASCKIKLENTDFIPRSRKRQTKRNFRKKKKRCKDLKPEIEVHNSIDTDAEVGSKQEVIFDVPIWNGQYEGAIIPSDQSKVVEAYLNYEPMPVEITPEGHLKFTYTVQEGLNELKIDVYNRRDICSNAFDYWYQRYSKKSCVENIYISNSERNSTTSNEVYSLQFEHDNSLPKSAKVFVKNNGETIPYQLAGNIGTAQIPLEVGFNHIVVSIADADCDSISAEMYITREIECPLVQINLEEPKQNPYELNPAANEERIDIKANISNYNLSGSSNNNRAYIHVLLNQDTIPHEFDTTTQTVHASLKQSEISVNDTLRIVARNYCCSEVVEEITFFCPQPIVSLYQPKDLEIPVTRYLKPINFVFNIAKFYCQDYCDDKINVVWEGRSVPYEYDAMTGQIFCTVKPNPLLESSKIEITLYNDCGETTKRSFTVRKASLKEIRIGR